MGVERFLNEVREEIAKDHCCAAYPLCFDEAVKFCSNIGNNHSIFTGCDGDTLTAVNCFSSMCVKILNHICLRHQGKSLL